jgi:hypothetical protein
MVDICFRTVIITKFCVIGSIHTVRIETLTGMLAVIYCICTYKVALPYSITGYWSLLILDVDIFTVDMYILRSACIQILDLNCSPFP